MKTETVGSMKTETVYESVASAAARCAVAQRTIRSAIDRGDLPACRPAGAAIVRLRVSDVDRWISGETGKPKTRSSRK